MRAGFLGGVGLGAGQANPGYLTDAGDRLQQELRTSFCRKDTDVLTWVQAAGDTRPSLLLLFSARFRSRGRATSQPRSRWGCERWWSADGIQCLLLPCGCSFKVRALVAQFCPTFAGLTDYNLPGSSVHRHFPGKNTGGDCHSLLQGIYSAIEHMSPAWQADPLPLSHCAVGTAPLRAKPEGGVDPTVTGANNALPPSSEQATQVHLLQMWK